MSDDFELTPSEEALADRVHAAWMSRVELIERLTRVTGLPIIFETSFRLRHPFEDRLADPGEEYTAYVSLSMRAETGEAPELRGNLQAQFQSLLRKWAAELIQAADAVAQVPFEPFTSESKRYQVTDQETGELIISHVDWYDANGTSEGYEAMTHRTPKIVLEPSQLSEPCVIDVLSQEYKDGYGAMQE